MKILSKFFYLSLIINISFAQNIDQEYIDAQKLFLEFQTSNVSNLASNLKKVLKNKEATDFLIDASQKIVKNPNTVNSEQTDKTIKSIKDEFIKKYKITNNFNDLEKLITSLISPDMFLYKSSENGSKFPEYKKLMDNLANHKTKTKQHTVKQWAIKNLISDSISTAVSSLKNKDPKNKTYYQFSDSAKDELLTSTSAIIAESFIKSLDKVAKNLNILNLPSISEREIEGTIKEFLKQKFK